MAPDGVLKTFVCTTHWSVYTHLHQLMFVPEQLKPCPQKEVENWRRQGKKNVYRKQRQVHRHHRDLCARPRRSCGVIGHLTALLWLPYGDPTTLLPERRATAFVLCMLKLRAVARHSMRSQRVYWRCRCVASVMLAIALRVPRCYAFFLDAKGIAVRTQLWCVRGFTLMVPRHSETEIHNSWILTKERLSLVIHWAEPSEKMPSSKRKMRSFRSCACATYHPGIYSIFIHSVVFNDSISGQWRPWSDCADAQADLGLLCTNMSK